MLENETSQLCAEVANTFSSESGSSKHLCTHSFPGSWSSNVVLEKASLEFTQRLLSKRCSLLHL